MKSSVALKDFNESDKQQGGKALPLSQEVQSGPLCFLNFSERSLRVAGFTPNPRLGQWLMSKGLGV